MKKKPARKAKTAAAPKKRVAVVQRLVRATESQVEAIEQRLAGGKTTRETRERDTRLLAVLAKTMRDLIALDTQDGDEAQTPQNDDVPRDLDELRRELARRVDRLRQRGADPETAG